MALDTTVGGATANSYASLAEANTYQTDRSPANSWWATATDPQKEAALKTATKLLDGMFKWTGAAVDNVQVLAWPRSGMLTRNGFAIPTNVNPQDLKNAQAEWAGQIGAQAVSTANNDALAQGITSVKAGSVALTFKELEASDEDVAMQNSDLFYLNKAVPEAVRFLIPPSWYTEFSLTDATTSSGLIFEAN